MANPGNLKPIQPGEVRNPNGRPKGSLNRSTIVKEILLGLHVSGVTNAEAATIAVLEKALSGDTTAWEKLMDSGFGKLTDKTDVNVKAEVNTDVTSALLSKYPTETLEEVLDDASNND